MNNEKEHNYIVYLLKKIDKKYNKHIILYYDPNCIRTNVIYNKEENQHLLTYGDRLIDNALSEKSHCRDYLRYVLAHEIGHIVHNVQYETFKEKVNSEYLAERFALNHLKEYYPRTYVWACKVGYSMVHDSKWSICKSEKHYRLAWESIDEYCK
jgi:hypothetical protein